MSLHFFISRVAEDSKWALWISRVLEGEGHTTTLQDYDSKPGHSFIHQIKVAEERAHHFIAVLSPRYLAKPFTLNELYFAISKERAGERRLLIPVRVEECVIPPLIQDRIQVDFVGKDETACQLALLDAIRPERIVELGAFPSPAPTATAWAASVRTAMGASPSLPESARLRVFLCHSSEDKPIVRTLYSRLREDGFQPWLDEEDLLPGQQWPLEIPRAVRGADVVIVCLSCQSITKTGYVQNEVKYALDVADAQPEGAIFIIPLRLEECEVPERLQRWQWVNYFDINGYPKLARALRARAQAASKRPL